MVLLDLNARVKTYDLLTLEAVLRRLQEKSWYNEKLISAYKKEKAGYDGERNVDYALSIFPRKDFLIIKGLRLENSPFHFQIDTLILSRNFILILEIKNTKGTLQYDSKQKQFTQIVDGNKKSYKDPIMQTKAQKNQLQIWLQRFGITGFPIETLVVVAFPSTIIENIRQDPFVYEKIIHTASLNEQIGIIEKKYTREVTSFTSIKKLASAMLQRNNPLRTDVLWELNINLNQFVKGVICKHCNPYPMIREYKGWFCPRCKKQDPRAHERDILDYFLLYGDTITNKECRDYLGIESPWTSQTILQSMKLEATGIKKGSVYHAPSLSEFPQQSYIPARIKTLMNKHQGIR